LGQQPNGLQHHAKPAASLVGLGDRVGLPAEDIPDDLTTTFDELGLDSLAFMEIALAVEQEYGVKVDEEDAERIATLGEALDYVKLR
jgi:acyl carrier protein